MDDLEDDEQESVNPEPELYKSVRALADALQVTRQTVHAWFKRPGCPPKRPDGMFDAAAWRAFAQSIGSKTAPGESQGLAELKEEDQRLKNEQRRKAIQRTDGLWTWNETLSGDITARVQEAISVLRAKFERELPSLYTADAAKNRALNKDAIDEVCERLSRPLACQEGAPGV